MTRVEPSLSVSSLRTIPNRRTLASGLTLVELLVAVAILGAAAVGILPGLAIAARVARLLERQSKAYFFALQTLDQTRIRVLQGEALEEDDSGIFRSGYDQIRWKMAAEPCGTDTQLRRVTLDLEWPRDRGKDTYRVRTLVRLPG